MRTIKLKWTKVLSLILLLITFGVLIKYPEIIKVDTVLGTLVLSILGSLFLMYAQDLFNTYMNIAKYNYLVGTYNGYGYENEKQNDFKAEDYYKIKDEVQSIVKLEHLDERQFLITLTNPNNSENNTWEWTGIAVMTSENMLDIGWNYTKWPKDSVISFENSAGYKRAVILKRDNKNVRIIMFSNDNQIYGREVLIKNK